MEDILVIRNTLRLEGRTRLTATDPKTGKAVKIIEGTNIIVKIGMEFVGDMLIDLDADHDTGLTWQAIGTNATIPKSDDDRLTAEATRKGITSRTRLANEITLSTFFTAAESTHAIKEAGIFGHASATATANSGKLFSHWLVDFNNAAGLFDITIDHRLLISA